MHKQLISIKKWKNQLSFGKHNDYHRGYMWNVNCLRLNDSILDSSPNEVSDE